MRASLASLAKRVTSAISPSSLAAVRTPRPRSASSRGASAATSVASSAWRSLMLRVSARTRRSSSRAMRTRAVCSARARRAVMRVCQPVAVSARGGITVSGQRSWRCRRRSLLSAVRWATSRSRWSTSRRMSSSGPANCATGSFSMPSRSAAIATASMASDFPRSRAAPRSRTVSLGATRTTASPRASRKRSSAPETCRQSSIAQTRSLPRPRAQTSKPSNERRFAGTVCSASARHSLPRPCATACACRRAAARRSGGSRRPSRLRLRRVGRGASLATHGLQLLADRASRVLTEDGRVAA